MKRHYLVDPRTGRSRAPLGEPTLSSSDAPWTGFLLEQHPDQSQPDMDVVFPHHTLLIQVTPGIREFRINGGPPSASTQFAGQAAIFPAMTAARVQGRTTGDLLAVTIEPEFLRGLSLDVLNPDRIELIPRNWTEDALLSSVVVALRDDVRDGHPGGRVYGETLLSSMVMHLLRSHSTKPPRIETRGAGGLGAASLRHVIEFVHAHLGEDVSLAALAGAVRLSPFHFSRAFKRATGLAPHQFVLRCRVERARDLLLHQHLSVADVAARVGFADQSHLSAHFKRAFGVTPAAWVRQMRGR